VATIIEFFVPVSFSKKGNEVDTAGKVWEGDSVQLAREEVRLTPPSVRGQGVSTLDEACLACCKNSTNKKGTRNRGR
jgi:hypothetical protein